MVGKTLYGSFLVGIVVFSLMNLPISAAQDHWWDPAWSFRQEVIFDLNTGQEGMVYQPIDLSIRFNSPCWAENETRHSIRVVCQFKDNDLVLESQIYALRYSDQTHITSCNLVFLIPPQADGTERYYIYYDESPTEAPNYIDHVSIQDSSYFYEPIPGYPLESHFYKISQENSIRYIVAQEGRFLWHSTGQCVTKLKEGSTEVMPKNGEAIASFEFVYYYGEEMWQYNSTSQELISKEILCDGNLMASCKICSRSIGGNLQTTAVYKYFYNPISLQRIQVHVIHEALKECPVYANSNTDGTYASLQCGGIRSNSIADLNFGKIYPFYHFYSERDVIEEHQVDLNPDYTQENPVVRLIQTSDDVDIGKNAWISFDEGVQGAVHALIFGNSSVVKRGPDERDGMQLKMYESNYPHLPGLDYTIAAMECTRNAYEKNVSGKDTIIPKGFIAEYDAEFFSSPLGGYPSVEIEARIFQALVPMKPEASLNQSSEGNRTTDTFSLRVFVHHAPSFPFGSVFSAITGRYYPYINVEVYRDDQLVCSGSAGRLPLKSTVDVDTSSLIKMFFATIRIVDLRNISMFKKFDFKQLEEGRYIIKVFKENPRTNTQRRFIGYSVIDLTKDSSIHVFCRPQCSCTVSLVDQDGVGISDASVMLFQDGVLLAKNKTNTEGMVLLTAPYSRRNPSQLKILYQGFEIANESIRLRYGRTLIPLKKTYELALYDWRVTLQDLWGLPPEIDVIPHLTSSTMQIRNDIRSTANLGDSFLFTDLVPAIYQLTIQYKSFIIEKEVQIPSKDGLVVFPAEYKVSFHVLNSHGITMDGATIQLNRGGKSKEITTNNSIAVLSVPPGLYIIKVISDGNVIGQRSLNVMTERSIELITNQEPIYPIVSFILTCGMILIGLALSLIKREPLYFLFVLIISISFIALFLPWWSLKGSSADIETSSILYMVPLDMISTVRTSQVIAGERAFFPDIFTTVMVLIPLLTVGMSFLIISILVLHHKNKKQWQSIFMIVALFLLLGSLVVFTGAMSTFAEVGVGSFIGQGTLDISIPGEESIVPVLCQWGPGFGFWLYVLSGLILISSIILTSYQKKKKRK